MHFITDQNLSTDFLIEENTLILNPRAGQKVEGMWMLLSLSANLLFSNLGATLTFQKSGNIWSADIPVSWRNKVVVTATSYSNNASLSVQARAHIATNVGPMDRILVAAVNVADNTALAVDLCVTVTRLNF